MLRVEALLQIGHPLDMRESDALGHVFLEAGGFRRVMIGEAKAPRIVDPEAPDETSIPHEEASDASPLRDPWRILQASAQTLKVRD